MVPPTFRKGGTLHFMILRSIYILVFKISLGQSPLYCLTCPPHNLRDRYCHGWPPTCSHARRGTRTAPPLYTHVQKLAKVI